MMVVILQEVLSTVPPFKRMCSSGLRLAQSSGCGARPNAHGWVRDQTASVLGHFIPQINKVSAAVRMHI